MPLMLLLDRMNVVAAFTLEKVDFYLFFGANNATFPIQFSTADRTWPRNEAGILHGVLHSIGEKYRVGILVQKCV